MKNANAILMKEINLNNVRQALKQIETATKPQLSKLTNLSVVTVNSLVKELLELGEIFEDETVPSNGGRPALTYRFNYDFSLALVISLKENHGNEHLTTMVVNLDNRILHKEEHLVPRFERQILFDHIERYLNLYPSVKVIGLGIPGQTVNGEVTVTSHSELKGIRLAEEIESKFNLPAMVENDVNAAVSGFYASHEFSEDRSLVGIYFPTKYPPGMGIYLNGRLVKGKNGMAGEIKFLPHDQQWSQMNSTLFVQSLCQLIHTVNAILAPDRVVVYVDRLDVSFWRNEWERYQQEHIMPSYPEVIQQGTFQEDFESGMRVLTLKELVPNIHFN
ncbi:transcriptional regulator [Paenibacillus pectinilyticus]|uniref:Transcriptional regulator n=1 Tax=Paenibacillus pectinilyticus TaxID=512399 RepID=A0A1C0ZZL8_9BACL|nr:ROK family protein [Paenibacillus pectinilyticus]OCT13568.1 transcriptional regulator [Paenibacillus pectinilyticus]